jgi:methyl-accepting chemotaxis protein
MKGNTHIMKIKTLQVGIQFKLILFITLIVLLGSGTIGYYAVTHSEQAILKTAQQKLLADLASGKMLLDKAYPGNWQVTNGKLYKGITLIDGNFDLIDEFGKSTGDTATIFLNDTRVTTNVKKEDGSRAVGTKVSDVVAEVILKQGKPYTGVANVVGQMNQAAYEPIKNEKGEIIGIWYVGVPNAPYEKMIKDFRDKIIFFGVIQLVIALAIIWIAVARSIKPLLFITKVAEQVSEGNLRVQMKDYRSGDEIGRLSAAVNRMIGNLQEMMSDIHEHIYTSADQVAVSSDSMSKALEEMTQSYNEVVVSNQSMAQDAQNGNQSVRESEHVLLELSALIQASDVKASEAVQEVKRTLDIAMKGKETVLHTITCMESIQACSTDTETHILTLHEYSKQIAAIASTITDIAGSTNLLALNASIEAARAGESGRGFAVVAGEVRKLAEQSNREAEEVNELIKKITSCIDRAVHTNEQSKLEVSKGAQSAEDAGKALEFILKEVNQTVGHISGILDLTKEEVNGSQRVTALLQHVSQTFDQTLSSSKTVLQTSEVISQEMEHLAAGSEELSAMASDLKATVGKITL